MGVGIWIVIGVAGVLLLLFLAGRRASRRGPTRGGAGRGRGAPGPDSGHFEYDDDRPMDWWDNQFGKHGFDD